ncbi:tetratricopeptide repeat protein [Sphingomonas sp.]|uniref:tetratricopeptide repeat protein n=1 Tax=Sphingomonas sp. TaxID=28214 RepID=UPI002DD658BB|nr:tetratricopeptide repeat protein [Sphingomonas sp.]
MRYLSVGAAIGLTLLSLSTSLSGQRRDDQVDARSVALFEKGKAARAAGNLAAATDLIETALVVDPRNRAAYLTLAEIARAQNLPGKAIRLYREALTVEPNDVAALQGQGEAMVQKGAVERARENLARIQKLCPKTCAEGTQLAAVIAKGPPIVSAAAQVAKQDAQEKGNN